MPKVDISQYQGREQAYVKHYLLEKYLPEWAYKVGTKWNSLAINLILTSNFTLPKDIRNYRQPAKRTTSPS